MYNPQVVITNYFCVNLFLKCCGIPLQLLSIPNYACGPSKIVCTFIIIIVIIIIIIIIIISGKWLKLWDMVVKGKMCLVIKTMYDSSRSAVLL